MTTFIQAIANVFRSLFGGVPAQATEPPPAERDETDLFDEPEPPRRIAASATAPPPPPTSPPLAAPRLIETITDAASATPTVEQLTAQATSRARIEHALVLPTFDFRDWFDATVQYTNAFPRTVIVRSPAGNNLNRYKTVTAVAAPRTWFNDDPLFHIRRAYPVVVSVDVINATTPAQLAAALEERVRTNRRFGSDANVFTRFTLDWMTDSFTLQLVRVFDEVLPNGRPNEGIDVAVTEGTTVRAAAVGTVARVETDENNSLGYGDYVQIASTADDGARYVVTYTNLQDIVTAAGRTVSAGEPIGASAGTMVKIVVQQEGVNTGARYPLPSVIDPQPLLYVNGLALRSTVTAPLNIRSGRGTQFSRVGDMANTEDAYTLELHGITLRKMNTTSSDNQWVNVDTASGVTGFAAAWFLQARSPYSTLPATDFNGVNLDLLNALGKPAPNRLGNVTYVRLPYNVSRGVGSQDLNAAFELYAPYIDALHNAGKQIILVYTHQTYGEGAGFVWPQMTPDRWRELSLRFADFVGQIARQYRGKIAAHQIWNEQDTRTGRAAVPVPPGDYAGILTRAIQSIRAADSTTPIITGGHTSGPGTGAAYARATLDAMPGSVRPDGIAAHPYGRGPDPSSKYAIFGSIDDSVQAYYNVLPGRRVWFTEWGVLNAQGQPAAEIRDYAVSFLEYLQATHPDKVAAAVWYGWADTMDNGYGLVSRNDLPKEPLYSNYIRIE